MSYDIRNLCQSTLQAYPRLAVAITCFGTSSLSKTVARRILCLVYDRSIIHQSVVPDWLILIIKDVDVEMPLALDIC